MHVLWVILGGLAQFGVFLLFGKLWGGHPGVLLAAKAFIPVWLFVSAANMWVGVTYAGYTVREELPILFLVFLLPAAVASGTLWYLSRG